MKFASVKNDFFELCKKYSADNELLYNTNRRPYLIVIKLNYKNKLRQFALPFRSDMSNSTPRNQYFSLPPRPTTKPGRRHGLHYLKMFPISNKYLEKFRTENNAYYEMIVKIIDKNEKNIIDQCQNYLNDYEEKGRPTYSPDIDKIIEILNMQL